MEDKGFFSFSRDKLLHDYAWPALALVSATMAVKSFKIFSRVTIVEKDLISGFSSIRKLLESNQAILSFEMKALRDFQSSEVKALRDFQSSEVKALRDFQSSEMKALRELMEVKFEANQKLHSSELKAIREHLETHTSEIKAIQELIEIKYESLRTLIQVNQKTQSMELRSLELELNLMKGALGIQKKNLFM